MKNLETILATVSLLILAIISGCSCNNPPPEIIATASSPAVTTATITQPTSSSGGPPEIHAFYARPPENLSIANAAAKAGPSGHVDLDVSNGQLVATPDKNSTHLTPSTPTLRLGTSKPVAVVISPAAQQFIQEHEIHKQP